MQLPPVINKYHPRNRHHSSTPCRRSLPAVTRRGLLVYVMECSWALLVNSARISIVFLISLSNIVKCRKGSMISWWRIAMRSRLWVVTKLILTCQRHWKVSLWYVVLCSLVCNKLYRVPWCPNTLPQYNSRWALTWTHLFLPSTHTSIRVLWPCPGTRSRPCTRSTSVWTHQCSGTKCERSHCFQIECVWPMQYHKGN